MSILFSTFGVMFVVHGMGFCKWMLLTGAMCECWLRNVWIQPSAPDLYIHLPLHSSLEVRSIVHTYHVPKTPWLPPLNSCPELLLPDSGKKKPSSLSYSGQKLESSIFALSSSCLMSNLSAIILILPSKYVLNLTTSPHLHPYLPSGGHLSTGLVWPFLLDPLQFVLHMAAKVSF